MSYFSDSIYGSKKWNQMRNAHLSKYPFCRICKSTLNLQVDHIFSFKYNNPSLFYDSDNLQTLCISHHSDKTVKDNNLDFVKKGEWILILDDKEVNNYDHYKKLFEHNFYYIDKYWLDEQTFNPYCNKIFCKDILICDLHRMLCLYISFFRSKPAKIQLVGTVPLKYKKYIEFWLSI